MGTQFPRVLTAAMLVLVSAVAAPNASAGEKYNTGSDIHANLGFQLITGPEASPYFRITAPKRWKRVPTSFNGSLFEDTYSKNRKTVLIYIRDTQDKDQARVVDPMLGRMSAIARLRSAQLEAMGIRDYAILGAQSFRVARHPEVEGLKIESQYRGFTNRLVHSLELKYFLGNRIYTVAYSEESDALGNRKDLESVLAQFMPKFPESRFPAGHEEINRDRGIVPRPGSQEPSSPQFRPVAIQEVSSDLECSSVDKELRRSSADARADALSSFQKGLSGCGDLLKNQAGAAWDGFCQWFMHNSFHDKGFVTTMRNFGQSAAAWPGKAIETGSAAFAAVVEAAKSPRESMTKMYDGISNFFFAGFENFSCYRPEVQGELICRTGEKIFGVGMSAAAFWQSLPLLLAGGKLVGEGAMLLLNFGKESLKEILSRVGARNLAVAGVAGKSVEKSLVPKAELAKAAAGEHALAPQAATKAPPSAVSESARVAAGETSAAKIGDLASAYAAELGEIGPGAGEVLDTISKLEANGIPRDRIKKLIKDGVAKCPIQ